ncbi:MAG: hypothetical protein JOZ62_21560 [Acidobacteriaceae bacterium]|nr:hypothetical protein [Acidobacteriaceae bacterium]
MLFSGTADTVLVNAWTRCMLCKELRPSPDLNRIEADFANLKKRRQYAPAGTPLPDIIKSYGIYCE